MDNVVGRRIREARISKDLTQRALAEAANISTSYMNLIESGRRPIAGNLLNKIAKILATDAAKLSNNISSTMMRSIWPLIEPHKISKANLEELLISQPEWLHIIQSFGHEIDDLKNQLNEATDRLSLDSGFSETFHQLLSRISSIRSTASILNTQGDLAKEKDSQFRNILHTEAREASLVAKQLMAEFEQTSQIIGSDSSSLQNLSSQLYIDQYYIPFLEDCAGKISLNDLKNHLNSAYGDHVANSPTSLRLFLTMAKDIEALPAKKFMKEAQNCEWDIEKLSVIFDTTLDRVLRRIAMLSKYADLPRISLNIYDQMGVTWLVGPITAFSTHKKIGCAYWPIFEQNSGTDKLLTKILSINDTDNFRAYAAHGLPNNGTSHRSIDRISTMISYPISPKNKINETIIHAGIDCSSCSKMDCYSRRNRSVSIGNL